MNNDELRNFLGRRLDKHIDILPEHMRDTVYRYVLDRVEPGSFLTAVLENDLRGAVAKADHINQQHIVQWAQFCMWALPMACHGSPANVSAWLEGKEV